MGRLKVKDTEWRYKEWAGSLNEQFINSINDLTVTAEIIKEMTIVKDASEITSKFCYGQR